MSWGYFEKYSETYKKYLPEKGEGTSLAHQTAAAVNRLVNMWFQNRDTYDNVHTVLYGGLNALSPCANWLYKYRPESRYILDRISKCCNCMGYEDILYALAELLLQEQELEKITNVPAQESIYRCEGPFKCLWDE